MRMDRMLQSSGITISQTASSLSRQTVQTLFVKPEIMQAGPVDEIRVNPGGMPLMLFSLLLDVI